MIPFEAAGIPKRPPAFSGSLCFPREYAETVIRLKTRLIA
jgi:hypothetical protein